MVRILCKYIHYMYEKDDLVKSLLGDFQVTPES